MAKNKSVRSEKPAIEKLFKDEQTDKRNHEHLTNENDQISEEDIQNVRTDIADPNENIHLTDIVNASELKKTGEKDEEIHDNSDTNIDTSWNILNS